MSKMQPMSAANMTALAIQAAQRQKDWEIDVEARRRADLRQKAENFPTEMMSERWRELVKMCLPKTAPFAHQISLGDFADVVAIDPVTAVITFFEYGRLSNSLEGMSPEALGLDRGEYKDFIHNECLPGIQYWNEKKNEWHKFYLEEVAEEEKMKKMVEKAEQLSKDNKLANA